MKRFSRKQLIFVVDMILTGIMDRIDSVMPHTTPYTDKEAEPKDPSGDWSHYIDGAMESGGMALACFYAQLTNDGLGIYDALLCAGEFDSECDKAYRKAWKSAKRIRSAQAKLAKKGKAYNIKTDLYAPLKLVYPDTEKHAEQFVLECFKEYLAEKAPTEKV